MIYLTEYPYFLEIFFRKCKMKNKNSDLNCMFSYRKCHLMKQEAFWEVQWTVPKQPPLEGEPVRKP